MWSYISNRLLGPIWKYKWKTMSEYMQDVSKEMVLHLLTCHGKKISDNNIFFWNGYFNKVHPENTIIYIDYFFYYLFWVGVQSVDGVEKEKS